MESIIEVEDFFKRVNFKISESYIKEVRLIDILLEKRHYDKLEVKRKKQREKEKFIQRIKKENKKNRKRRFI